MNADKLRNMCAKEAMKYIQDDFIIGLGAGRNIGCLIDYLSQSIKEGLNIKVVTPSDSTKSLCVKYGIEVLPTCFVDELDVAFDGCGEVDNKFNASKGGGGVFTKEKIIASMAKEYILLVDEQKFVDKISSKQAISLEVVKDSVSYVNKRVKELGGIGTVRADNIKDGYIITDDGNFLIDIEFNDIRDPKKLNHDLNNIHGVIGTSLFVEEVTKIIIAGEKGIRVVLK